MDDNGSARLLSPADNEYVDDGGLCTALISYVRIVICFIMMLVTTFIWAIIMFLLLPWPSERNRQGNVYGHDTDKLLLSILGNPIHIEGTEFAKERAIYVSNHASPIDIFLVMWLTPTGTVGIAKKEIIWHPLLGQLYLLAKHIRIDPSNQSAAIQSMGKEEVGVSDSFSIDPVDLNSFFEEDGEIYGYQGLKQCREGQDVLPKQIKAVLLDTDGFRGMV